MTKILDMAAHPQLAEILNYIKAGDDVILMRDGQQIAEVKPVEALKIVAPRKERVLGLGSGTNFYMADDFDAELPESFWMGEE